MSFWKRLFGLFRKRSAQPPTSRGDPGVARRATPSKSTPQMVNQGTRDAPIKIDPRSITHAFVALTHDDLSLSGALGTKVIELNKGCQPRLWNTELKVKCASFALNPSDAGNGFPDLRGVGPALERIGLKGPYTIVASAITVAVGGSSGTKVLVGFAHQDPAPKLVLAEHDRCVPRWIS